jgi:ubiquinol-cytochrome c reductase cytochrome c1 subunit
MKKVIAALLFAALPALAFANTGGPALDSAKVNLSDKESLQRGAKLFVNYCLSCHSAQYMRYNRVGQDLGMTDEEVKANLILNGAKVGDTMKVAMTPADAKAAFGVVPPDLSVIARSRGADYLYTYLRSFYADPKRPFGVNNTVFPDVGMPHVLAELQGVQTAVYKTEKDAEGKEVHEFEKFELTTPGSQTAEQYDATVTDLVNYLVYMGEPAQLQRTRIGWWVLGFLGLVLLPVSYLLKKEYWKDVH